MGSAASDAKRRLPSESPPSPLFAFTLVRIFVPCQEKDIDKKPGPQSTQSTEHARETRRPIRRRMQRLETWVKERGFTIECSPGAYDSVDLGPSRTVTINSRQSRRSKMATLLHECGHILIHASRRRSKDPRKPVAGVSLRDAETDKKRYARNSRSRRLAIMTEELEAWERGWALGRRLKLVISKKYFEGVRVKAVMTYVRWTSSP